MSVGAAGSAAGRAGEEIVGVAESAKADELESQVTRRRVKNSAHVQEDDDRVGG